MRRSFDFHSSITTANPQYGWNTTSPEYVEHVKRMQKMPSMITTDAASTLHDDHRAIYGGQWENKHLQVDRREHDEYDQRVASKKVYFTDQHEKTGTAAQVVKDVGKGTTAEVYGGDKKDIDMEADGFIKQKHKNFEMLKWPTFKVC